MSKKRSKYAGEYSFSTPEFSTKYGNASELMDKNKEYADNLNGGGLSTDKKYDIASKLAMAAGSGEQNATSGAISGGATGFLVGDALATSMAAKGATVGPTGALVGAGIGGVLGLLSGKSAADHRDEQVKYANNRRAMENLIGITKGLRL